MENEFVPYEEALALKKLGFIGVCFGYYSGMMVLITDEYGNQTGYENFNFNKPDMHGQYCTAPLYQQAFQWFIEECSMDYHIFPNTDDGYYYQIGCDDTSKEFDTYEEAREACLKEMIQQVKNNL